ncbi:MAG: glycosyltransferase [Candidatus Omnitrophota bacterium]
MGDPIISIVIPAYNRKDLLKECLDSLFDQTYPKEDYEIVVVDDGSTDGTEDMLKAMAAEHGNLRYFRQENGGMFPAWNKAASLAKGDILVMTDSDCVAGTNLLEAIVKCFKNHPDISACAWKTIPVFSGGIFSPVSEYLKSYYSALHSEDTVFPEPNPSMVFGSCSGAVKRDVFWSIGGFAKKFAKATGGADADLGFRILSSGNKVAYLAGAYIYHRQRNSLKELMTRHFKFGVIDTVNFKDNFKKWAVIFLPSGKCFCARNSPVTVSVYLSSFEIVGILVFISFFFPKIGGILLLAYFIKGYAFSKSNRNLSEYFSYKLYQLFILSASFAGHIVGSIKNRVICI